MTIQVDPNDREYEEGILESVEPRGDYYALKHDGWTLGCPVVDGLPPPQTGETFRYYGRGSGYTVRGIVVGGRVYRYQTAQQERATFEAETAKRHAEREREMAEQADAVATRVGALPAVFRERIEKFRRDGGHAFRRDFEPYELFVCEQAVVIADALKTPGKVTAFHKLDWTQQKMVVPGLDDGHSGNTFGMACRLALLYLESPEFVTKMHGALTPLVGCDAYGCKHEEPR